MTHFSSPHEHEPEPVPPSSTSSTEPEAGETYSALPETPLTAPPETTAVESEAFWPEADDRSDRSSAMTAPDWGSAEPEPSIEDLLTRAPEYIQVNQPHEQLYDDIASTVAWLGPRLAELERPPDAAGLVDPTPHWDETDREGYEHFVELAPELPSGWLVATASVPYGPPENAFGDHIAAAIALVPSGALAAVDGCYFDRPDRPWAMGEHPSIFRIQEDTFLAWDDTAEGVDEDDLSRFFSSSSVASALNRFIGRLGLSEAELRARFPQANTDRGNEQ